MSKVSLFTGLYYTRPTTNSEKSLSAYSNYFCLSNKIVVVTDDCNLLTPDTAQQKWYTIALKIVSYFYLFPLTLCLFTVYIVLRNTHEFTMITSESLSEDSSKEDTPRPTSED